MRLAELPGEAAGVRAVRMVKWNRMAASFELGAFSHGPRRREGEKRKETRVMVRAERIHPITMHLVMSRMVVDKWWWWPHGSGDCRERST